MNFLLEAVILGTALLGVSYLWFDNRDGRTLAYLYCAYWTLAVVGIFLVFGDQQSLFYSGDQVVMQRSVLLLQQHGIDFSLSAFIGQRYIVSLPSLAITFLGFSSLAAYKFIQGVSALILLRLVLRWSHENEQPISRPLLLLAFGPSLLLNSVLALRDSVLAASVTLFFLDKSWKVRGAAFFVVFSLRPQLAMAILCGVLLSWVLTGILSPITLGILGYFAFAFGAWVYTIANSQLSGTVNAVVLNPFTKEAFLRLLTSFAGLQFLVVSPDTRNLEFVSLIALRGIFIDTWLSPLLFIVTFLLFGARVKTLGIRLMGSYLGACIYFGIASQTDFTSSRQTMPFFATFAIMAATVWREAFASRPSALLPTGRSLYPKR